MNHQQRIAKLKRAQRLIEEASADADSTFHHCGSCGGKRFDDYSKHLAYERIKGLSDRVVSILIQLETARVQPDGSASKTDQSMSDRTKLRS